MYNLLKLHQLPLYALNRLDHVKTPFRKGDKSDISTKIRVLIHDVKVNRDVKVKRGVRVNKTVIHL